ncbi:MAG: hypothetical protein QNK37_04920 [Acidobacteriota bacterium]|nr:hypothetical protein [Acidobacteriota bacterium]
MTPSSYQHITAPDMPQLSTSRISSMLHGGFARFVEGIQAHLAKCFGRGWDRETRLDLVERAVRTAWSYRVTGFHGIMSYLHLVVVLGEGFENREEFVAFRRLLQHPNWPAVEKMENVTRAVCRKLEESGRSQDAVRLQRAARKLSKTKPVVASPDPVTPLLPPVEKQSGPIRVKILQGGELSYHITPGIRRALLEIQAAATPEGGYFHWQIYGGEQDMLTTRGNRAWFRPRKFGEARVTVTYYHGGRQDTAAAVIRVRPAARIRLSPASRDFGRTLIGSENKGRPVTIANIGGSPFQIQRFQPPEGFFITADSATGKVLKPDEKATITFAFKPDRLGPVSAECVIPCQVANPRDAVLVLSGEGVFPDPEIDFVVPGAGRADFLMPGLWDHAYHARTGELYNGLSDKQNFIGRDSNRFTIRLTDHLAAEKDLLTCRVDWWVRRDSDNSDAARPMQTGLTLYRQGRSAVYESSPLLLATDPADYHQPVHSGRKDGDLVQPGMDNHRLRLLDTEGENGLDRHVVVNYHRGAEPKITRTIPVFSRQPENRRRLSVDMIDVRDARVGEPIVGARSVTTLQQTIRNAYARRAVLSEFRVTTLDPPAVDRGVDMTCALGYKSGGKTYRIPSPEQLQLIDLLGEATDRVFMIMVGTVYDPLSTQSLPSEAFSGAFTMLPDEDLINVCHELNRQYTARELAAWLNPSAPRFQEKGWTEARRKRLQKALTETHAAVERHPFNQYRTRARVFLDTLERLERGNGKYPKYIAETIHEARYKIHPVFYKPATLGAMMEAARGCVFLSKPDGLSKNEPLNCLKELGDDVYTRPW